MIRHVWSVLCEKSIIDRDTNNISLDVLERVAMTLQGSREDRVLVPTPIRLVSLWQHDGESSEPGRARVRVLGPGGDELGKMEFDFL